MRTKTKWGLGRWAPKATRSPKCSTWALASGLLFVGSYGCRQVIGWEEATYWGDGGAAGTGESSSSSSGGGMGGAAGMGMGGIGGMGGAGGSGGVGGPKPQCVTPMDCPSFPNSNPTCVDGLCDFTCKAGFGDCTVGAGCETNVTDNKAHCGACSKTCAAYCDGLTCNDPVSIAGGYHHHCAVMKNGDVYCWGRNEKGELGDGTLASKSKPTKVMGLPGPAVQVDGGASASAMNYTPKTCAVLASGDLYCWGEGNSMPAKVNGLSNVKEVSVGDAHTCAVTKTGQLYCWGSNFRGQVGDGTSSYVPAPFLISANVQHVSAGAIHTCTVKSDAGIACWGDNTAGQLGTGSTSGETTPAAVSGISGVVDISCGNQHTCAQTATNLYCWGSNILGQLGFSGMSQSLTPHPLGIENVQGIGTGYNFSAAIVGGNVVTWGFNMSGQLGNGTTTTASTPQTISIMDGKMLGLSSISSCALQQSGNIWCWGANMYGQLGDGSSLQALTPKKVSWP
jgi:alpha-tubulin suppressor-like RCC1 family protein